MMSALLRHEERKDQPICLPLGGCGVELRQLYTNYLPMSSIRLMRFSSNSAARCASSRVMLGLRLRISLASRSINFAGTAFDFFALFFMDSYLAASTAI